MEFASKSRQIFFEQIEIPFAKLHVIEPSNKNSYMTILQHSEWYIKGTWTNKYRQN